MENLDKHEELHENITREKKTLRKNQNKMSVLKKVEWKEGFPGDTSGKDSAGQCKRRKRHEFDPWSGRSPGMGKGNLLQYFSLENSMKKGAWQATDHGTAKS